jgi:hypothetical protein
MKWQLYACLAVGLAAPPIAGTALSNEQGDEQWKWLLESQLRSEVRCDLAGTLYVREMPGSEGITRSGRAKCVDGRLYDFSQDKPHSRFTFKICDPVAC